MNPFTVEQLRPDPRALAYPACPEIEAAIRTLESAHATLVEASAKSRASVDAPQPDPSGQKSHQQLVEIAFRAWKAGPLLRFHNAVLDACATPIAALAKLSDADADAIESRHDAVAAGFGRLLGG